MNFKAKVDLILECYEETGEPIKERTKYRGISVGSILFEIRSKYMRGIEVYPQEQLARLEEKGLLDKKRKRQNEIVKELKEYCKNNPNFWLFEHEYKNYIVTIDDEQKRSEVIQAHNEARQNYLYLYRRKNEGKLDEKICERLKEAGVGGIFGYPSDTNLFAQKTGISMRKAQVVLTDFGGLNKFRKEFIELMIDRNTENHKKMEEIVKEINQLAIKEQRLLPFIQGFDITQPNYIASNDVFTALRDKKNPANSKQFGLFVVEQEIIDLINSQKDCKRRKAIIEALGLFGAEKKAFKDIAKNMGNLLPATIYQKVQFMQEKIGKYVQKYQREISESGKEKFIRAFFLENDIFSEGIQLTPEVKQKLFEIYMQGIQEIKDEREICRKEYEVTPENIARKLGGDKKIYLDEIGFSERAINALKNSESKIETLQDFLDNIIEWEDLYKIRNLGKKTIEDIKEKLNKLQVTIYTERPGYQEEMEAEKMARLEKTKELIKKIKITGKNISIAELDLTIKTIQSLREVGIFTINDLIEADRPKLKGTARYQHILKELHEIGIYFYWERAPKIGEHPGRIYVSKETNEKPRTVEEVYKYILGNSENSQDKELAEMIEELIKAKKILQDEERECTHLGILFPAEKKENLKLINGALKNNIER